MSLHRRGLSLNRLTTSSWVFLRRGFFIILIMNNLLIGIIIGALLGVVVFSLLTELCPPVREMGAAWDELAKKTHPPP